MRHRGQMILRGQEPLPAWPAHGMPPVAPAPVLAPPLPPEPPEPQLVKPIIRRFWIVLLAMTLAGVGAWVYLRHAQPLYTSESRIYIESVAAGPVAAPVIRAQRDNELATQAEFIRSTPVLTRATQRPELQDLQVTRLYGSLVPYLRKNLNAELERRNDLISVSIATPFPEESAKIVNAVVAAYMDYQGEARDTAGTRLLDEMRARLQAARAELAQIDQQIDELRVRNPRMNFRIDGTATGSHLHQQITLITHALTEAELQLLRMRASYMPGHPQLQAAQAHVAEIDARFREVQSQIMRENAAEAQFMKLASEQQRRQQFANRLEEQVRDLELSTRLTPLVKSVEIVEPAIASWSPSHPRRTRTLAGALVGGFLLGCVLALVRDRTDGRLRNPEEVQAMGVPVLGVVPRMSGRRTAVARAMAVHLDPRSPVSEAYRTVRTALYFGCPNDTCRTILMTSPEPGDGKTTSASNLAIAIAQTGRSVLLLDADFRKPTQHKNLDIKDAVGLSSVLAGKAELEQAIQHTGVSGLDILPCGPIPANPSEILNSRQFGELMDTLAGRYDHVIFDSPPCNLVADARILGAVCDVTILVLRADKSTKKSGLHARDALASVGARVLGAIINDAPKNSAYGQYYGSYYGPAHVPVTPATPVQPRYSQPRLPTAPTHEPSVDGDESQDQQDHRRRDIA